MPFSSGLTWLIDRACHGHEDIASALGLSPWQFGSLVALLYGILFLPVWFAWRVANRQFNRNGFANGVWRGWIYIVGGFTILQILDQLPVTGTLISCPYDLSLVCGAVVLAIYGLYCFHLGTGKTGSFSKFFALIVVPIFGEVTSLKPGTKLLQDSWPFLQRGWEMLTTTLAHAGLIFECKNTAL
jgi:hypothetical protein